MCVKQALIDLNFSVSIELTYYEVFIILMGKLCIYHVVVATLLV